MACLWWVPWAGAEPIRAVATVGMVADLVRAVGGPEVEVSTIIGEGIDPHVYKPTRNDVVQLQRAEVVFYNGLLLEGRMADVLGRLRDRGKPVVAVAEVIQAERLLAGYEPGHHDPHVWMDVRLWSEALAPVAEALASVRPEQAEAFRERAEAYRRELETFDAYVRATVETIPEAQRLLITAHDAFHYFGKAYGLEVMGIQGLSTESEAGLHDINRLVDVLVARGVGAIFVETSVADKNVKALVEGAQSRGHPVVIGGSLFSDAMGTPGTPEGTYRGMIEHNVSVIARALGGSVPEGGYAAWAAEAWP
jgi:manganese/zinc/iron transport system substrate-binding protein